MENNLKEFNEGVTPMLMTKKRFQFSNKYLYGSAAFILGFAGIMTYFVNFAPVRVPNASVAIIPQATQNQQPAEQTSSTTESTPQTQPALPLSGSTTTTAEPQPAQVATNGQAPATPAQTAPVTPASPSTPTVPEVETPAPAVPPVEPAPEEDEDVESTLPVVIESIPLVGPILTPDTL